MKLYLDTCCYSRPYDDQVQEKVHMEGEAILTLINRFKHNKDEIMGSQILDIEIDRIDDIEKKEKIKSFYGQTITSKINYNADILKRVQELSILTKIRTLDMFHLSFAEIAETDILLTTDTGFEKACSRLNLIIQVTNPLKYLMEVM
jgi:predicted nucleic acid-binding protein